jgi:hypothetical protein
MSLKSYLVVSGSSPLLPWNPPPNKPLVNTSHGFIGYGMFYMPNGMVILRRM